MAMKYRSNGNGFIPAQIKCVGCGKFKPQSSYANNRLEKLRRTGGVRPDTHIMCIPCTPDNAKTELKCYHCDKVKVITDFAKTQRAKDEPVSLSSSTMPFRRTDHIPSRNARPASRTVSTWSLGTASRTPAQPTRTVRTRRGRTTST